MGKPVAATGDCSDNRLSGVLDVSPQSGLICQSNSSPGVVTHIDGFTQMSYILQHGSHTLKLLS
jgi:hypothetical protein